MHIYNKQLPVKILIIYLISALLFLTSIELHIHTQETAVHEEHGAAVSISSLSSELMPATAYGEINVSPDGVLKIEQDNYTVLAVFLLIALITTATCRTCILRLRESSTLLPDLPFYGAALLRAPPQ